jgi:Terminase DNA packaging enzyme
MSKKISEVFDVEPVASDISLPIVHQTEESVTKDSELARKNIRGIIDVGNRALEHAYEVATQSESPRAYEVLSTMLKTMADINSQLLDIHKKEKDISGEKVVNNTVTNVAFVGTTKELNELIMERMKKQ